MHPNNAANVKFYKKKWFKIAAPIAVVAVLIMIGFLWKTGSVLNKISSGGLFSSLIHSIPGVDDELDGQSEDRINILLLGMRGENVPGGGLLADTIILASIKPKENKLSMISIPRDLYVTVPGTQDKQKINAVHHYGEQKGKGQGLADMKIAVGEVTGIPVHYAASINFAGFKQLIDAIGGIEITLEHEFNEPLQFKEPHVCNEFFNVPTGKFEEKQKKIKDAAGNVIGYKPKQGKALCTAPDNTLECGGNFALPAGKQTLNGEQTLCYVRSRVTSNDFERAKRQQQVLQMVKNKLLSTGTLTDFGKLNGILNSLGDNARSDFEAWEMKSAYDLYSGMKDPQIYQRVLENSEEGFLYNPPQNGAGYILLPRGDNYDKIHEMAKNIFSIAAQSDIKPK